jgi:threonine/homoserine/homoserine lactone efflux protein
MHQWSTLRALQRWPGQPICSGRFRRALVISLLNPKAILFLLSFFVQFIDPAYAQPEVPFLILSAILMGFSAAYLTVLIFAGARLAQTFSQRKRLSGGLSSLVGGLVCVVWQQTGHGQPQLISYK